MGLEAEIDRLSRELGEALQARGWLAATAESCTGGGVATAITDIAGSSGWFDRGFVTYTNEAKQQMLGVSIDSFRFFGGWIALGVGLALPRPPRSFGDRPVVARSSVTSL